MSFRKAYQKTSAIINLAEKKKKNLSQLSLKELQIIEPKLTNEVFTVFDLKNSVKSKKSYGGTSFENIKRMIMKYDLQKSMGHQKGVRFYLALQYYLQF